MSAEVIKFGDHWVGDCCPYTYNAGTLPGLLRAVGRVLSTRVGLDQTVPLYKKYGLFGFKRSSLERSALELVKQFILSGGTQQEPLSTLLPPSIIHPNNYPLDTVMRFTIPIHEFDPEAVTMAEWRRKNRDKVYNSHQVLAEGHISKIARNLGVVVKAANGQELALVLFWAKEEYLVADEVRSTSFITDSFRLGDWGHVGLYGLRIPLINELYFQDTFFQFSKMEILKVGERVTEKEPAPTHLHAVSTFI